MRVARSGKANFISLQEGVALQEGVTIPCGPGCDACCYDIATVIEPEALELAERVRSMPQERREGVIARMGIWIGSMMRAGLSVRANPTEEGTPFLQAYHRAHLPCPLLDTSRKECMVYDVRPLSCRGHFVLAKDASPCANRAEVPVITTLSVFEPAARAVVSMAGGDLSTVRGYRERLLTTGLVEALGLIEVD